MRLLLSVAGTRGDVQPVIALAVRARDHGHDVHLCIPPNFISWANELGFGSTPVGIEMRAPRNGAATATAIPDLFADQFDSILGAAQDCDVIVGANAHQYAARSVAELRGIPYVNALYAPTALPSDDNVRVWNERSREPVNANRKRLGLPPVDNVLRYIVTDRPWLATDPMLSPAPEVQGLTILQTGAWMFADTRSLPTEVLAFLDDGSQPVYFGFGSMPVAEGISRLLVDAARRNGFRAIVSRGWGGLALVDNASDCIEIDDVNHRELFQRVAVVVHHGGAGTTHTAAHVGVPQVIMPMFGDQFYWASRVSALGIGTSTLPSELSAERLAAALDEATRPDTRARATDLAPSIATNGVDVAVELLSKVSSRGKP